MLLISSLGFLLPWSGSDLIVRVTIAKRKTGVWLMIIPSRAIEQFCSAIVQRVTRKIKSLRGAVTIVVCCSVDGKVSHRFVAGSGKGGSAEVVPSKHASKGKTGSVKSKNTQEDPLASTSLDRETVVSNATNSSDSGGCKSDAAQSARTTDPMDNGGNEDLMERYCHF